MRSFVFSLLTCLGALIAASGIAAQRGGPTATADRSDPAAVRAANIRFAGTWKLIDQEIRDANGQTVPSTRNNTGRLGYIAYDPAGYMGVTIQSPERAKFAGRQPTPEEA